MYTSTIIPSIRRLDVELQYSQTVILKIRKHFVIQSLQHRLFLYYLC